MGRLWMLIATGAAILLLSLLFGLAYPRTKYAPGFSEAKFRQIRIGMSTGEVVRILGGPLYISYGGQNTEYWPYSDDVEGGRMDIGYFSKDLWISNDVVVHKASELQWFPEGRWKFKP